MPKTALVINPWVTDFKLYDEWMHPLGLYFLISLLKHYGWDVTYINCLLRNPQLKAKRYNTGHFDVEEIDKPSVYKSIPRKYKRYGITRMHLVQLIQDAPEPDIVFVSSAMTYWIDGLKQTVDIIRTVLPGKPIIIGGIAAQLMPDILKQRIPDSIIFPKGILSNVNEFASLHPSLAGLLNSTWEPSLLGGLQSCEKLLHGPALISLGCPMRCSYCASRLLYPRFIARPYRSVIEEISYCADISSVRDFAFYDDALLYRAEKNLLPFLNLIHDLTPHIRFHTPNGLHLRWLTPQILEKMKNAGFVTLRFGYESGNTEFARYTSAKADRDELAKKIAIAFEAGYEKQNIGVYVMGGLPGQDVQSIHSEIDFIASLGAQPKPVFLSPVPRTPAFKKWIAMFPQLATEPLWQNDLFFAANLDGWSWEAIEEIRQKVRTLNGNYHPADGD